MRGSKPGERRGGRQRGTKNRHTIARENAQRVAAETIGRALGERVFDGDAHALLMSVYKDQFQPIELRVEAAKAALPFEKPRLAAKDGNPDRSISFAEIVESSIKTIDVQPAASPLLLTGSVDNAS